MIANMCQVSCDLPFSPPLVFVSHTPPLYPPSGNDPASLDDVSGDPPLAAVSFLPLKEGDRPPAGYQDRKPPVGYQDGTGNQGTVAGDQVMNGSHYHHILVAGSGYSSPGAEE